jgi:hypothetical protein
MSDSELSNSEPVFLISGNLGTPGAPVLNLALMYDTELGVINGHGTITQSVAPPNGRLVVNAITGQVLGLGFGKATRSVSLTGTYQQQFTPPAIGQSTEKFQATFVTDNNWQGHGTFSYGGQTISNVPVKPRG